MIDWKYRNWLFSVFYYIDDTHRLKGVAFDCFQLPPMKHYKYKHEKEWHAVHSYHLNLLILKYTVSFELRRILKPAV